MSGQVGLCRLKSGEVGRKIFLAALLRLRFCISSFVSGVCFRFWQPFHDEHLFIREGTRRGAKNTFLSTKGHEEPRRTPFHPRRHAKGREVHLFVHEGPRRTSKNTSSSAKAREGARRTPFCPRRATEGHEEHFFIREGTRRGAKNTFLSTKGHGGPRRTLFHPRRHAKGREEHLFVHEGPLRIMMNTVGQLGFYLGECAGQPHFAAADRVGPDVNEPQSWKGPPSCSDSLPARVMA